MDLLLDKAVCDLQRAEPLELAAALTRVVSLQAALIRDLRNRVARIEPWLER